MTDWNIHDLSEKFFLLQEISHNISSGSSPYGLEIAEIFESTVDSAMTPPPTIARESTFFFQLQQKYSRDFKKGHR
jgi:hypothetical protein